MSAAIPFQPLQAPAEPSAQADAARAGGPAAAALRPDAPFRRALVVANPIAGRGRGRVVGGEVAEGLRRMGVASDLHLTRGRGDGRARVRCLEQGFDLVVSVGGDGTLREVFDGLCDERIPVGVLPLGTANVLGLDLNLPRDVDRALEVIAARKLAPIDVGTVNGHLSFLVTGVGLDGMAVRELEARRTGPITRWTYTGAILRALKDYRPPRLRVEVEGAAQEGEYGLVLISNIIHYGGVMRLSSDRRLDDGLFEVYLFRDASPRSLVSAAVRGFLSQLPGGTCRLLRARRVRVTSQEPVPYHVDGDYRGETPIDFQVSGRQFRLLVP